MQVSLWRCVCQAAVKVCEVVALLTIIRVLADQNAVPVRDVHLLLALQAEVGVAQTPSVPSMAAVREDGENYEPLASTSKTGPAG